MPSSLLYYSHRGGEVKAAIKICRFVPEFSGRIGALFGGFWYLYVRHDISDQITYEADL